MTSDDSSAGYDDFPRSLLQKLDEFGQAWERGERPRIDDYIGDLGAPLLYRVFPEFLSRELDCRRKRGEVPTLEEYQQRFEQGGYPLD